MKATIKDTEALLGLNPINIIGYLKAKGWAKFSERSDIYTVWHHAVFEDAEILVPFKKDAPDYVSRVSELIKELEQAEARSQLSIIRDLYNSGFDLIRLRARTPASNDGTVKIDEGVKFFTEAKELMLSAACSTLQPRPYYHAKRPQEAQNYMNKVRLGQTEQGSYVLTILSPVAPQLTPHGDTNLFPETPFERKVVTTLARSLNSVIHAAQRATLEGNFDPFQEAIQSGVSANLCESIVRLFNVDETNAFDVGISWALNRPPAQGVQTRITLSDEVVPVLEEASKLYRARENLEDYLLEGTIIKLERNESDTVGKATVYGKIEDSMKKVVVALRDHAYRDAVTAHEARRPVQVTGTVIKEGRQYKIDNPVTFSSLTEEEE